ncbi:Ribosomal large subunit pseudouridine synthase C (23S rRNA pseudouridine(955/2504/2580) synthase) (rRNA pseudouridylate synthase C) (rRNA-uridine isomerase C) [Durusdinium trenchii]|uniref:Ribosomal large subunit pseudouridine synthase C (23S rRNA pseudouridine(955/2504/2580) synthase) (rRNA pseudouridylate synthase C) (rRNA-uridine isomerase C) n=1 Tax=Durusdinium trenchii TaxID=1381693 RepID=A0ABP0IVE4_9DINO
MADVPFMHAIASHAAPQLSQWPIQEVVNSAWAFAKLSFFQEPLWRSTQHAVFEQLPQYSAQDLSSLTWVFATLASRGSMWEALLRRVQLRCGAFEPQHLALTAWACGVLAWRDDCVLTAIVEVAMEKIDAFGSADGTAPCQDLSLMFWALAALGLLHEPLLDALGERTLQKVEQLRPQHLANISWGLGCLQVRLLPLLHALGARCIKLADEFGPQEAANSAWAFGKVGVVQEPLMSSLAQVTCRTLQELDPQELSNVLWTFATLLTLDDPLFEAAGRQAIGLIEAFDAQNVSNSFWSFTSVVLQDPPLLEALCGRAAVLMDQLTMQQLANVAWSFATISVCHHPLHDFMARRAQELLRAEDPGNSRLLVNVCALAWSYTFMQQSDQQLLQVAQDRVLMHWGSTFRVAAGGQRSSGPAPPTAEPQPSLVSVMRGMCLVMKPAGWEVDSEGQSGLPPLSGFLRGCLPENTMVDSVDFGKGFIHRLDTPSSGLILAATSFHGYCCLEWQMYTYQIARDYVVLSHDLVAPPLQLIQRRLLDRPTVVVSERGRPAESSVRLLAHWERGAASPSSLLAIRIHTGRRHQIRAHLQSSGAPSVADHRYGFTQVVLRSKGGRSIFVEEGTTIWEGRNLLAITTVFVCSRLVSFLRAGSSTGHLVRTLIIIFWDMSSFFWVMSVMLLTFVFAFQLLYDQPFTFEGLGATMWYVYMHGIFGDADDVVQQPRHDDNSGSLTARLLLVICVVVMLVVMMNFLIAIMSDSYDKVQESAEVARNVMRLELVYEVGLVDAFSFVLCVCVCVFLLLFDVLTFAKFKTGVESRFETLEHLNFLVGGYASPRGLREAEVANIVRRCHRTAKWPPKATCGGFWRGAHRRGAARVRGVGGVWCCV